MKKASMYIAIFLAALMLLSGCRSEERPNEQTKESRQQAEKPQIPEEISQGEGQEPLLKVYVVAEGQIREMKFEEYLAGVVAGEMNTTFPEEALKAQAILFRTFVMEFVTDNKQSKYEGAYVSTDIQEAQAYDASKIDDKIRQAVESTRGQVAVYEGDYIKAWFHAHGAGYTATPLEGLGYEESEVPYVQGVESKESSEAPPEDVNWSATFSKGQVAQAAQQSGKNPGAFNTIEIAEKGPSGRATKFKIGNATVAAPAFRVALDSTRMKSTQLTNISVSGDQVTFEGTGYGHGVGMSQWGAYQMAQEGSKAEEIVQHYFQNVQVVKLWE